ncbi:UNKNOWN [Stylonychia lemnae]|uniref:Ankyrin repeat-containing protein n=1 Tax=Stylonychia lemnae TaxID=5949 RepID=A0A078ASW8_STYLE|nr:UNKNOWN [Stylonychia lemnae]|eukprot:CDW84307.1 UNKNOWN [Stylonychia lemnae]
MGCCQQINSGQNQPKPIRPTNHKPIKALQQGDGQGRQSKQIAETGPKFTTNAERLNAANSNQGGRKSRNDQDNNVNNCEDIEIVMVDMKNIPQDVGKLMMQSDFSRNYRPPSARSSAKGSFYSNMDFSHINLPVQLKTYHEILQMIVKGETSKVIELIQEQKFNEIVGIRGLNLTIEDIEFENGQVETIMWNPLHFAIYYQNFELVQYFIKDLKINMGVTGPKSKADLEKDAFNIDRYPEDKIMSLLLAYDRRDQQILKYLLDEGYKIWPSKCINNLLSDRLNNDIQDWFNNSNHQGGNSIDMEKMWTNLIQVILRSKTAHSFYGSLSIKKRKEWLYEFLHSLEQQPEQIIATYYQEFTLQPYTGFFLTFLLFEELSENLQLVQKVFQNANDFDIISFIITKQIGDPSEYYDINKVNKLKDKLSSEVGAILGKFINNIIRVSQELNASEFIKQSNTMLLEIANKPDSTIFEFQTLFEQLKEYNYLVQIQMMQVKGLDQQLALFKTESYVDKFQQQMSQQLQDQLQGETEGSAKWNPMTFAIYQGNLELIKYLAKHSICNMKKLLKIPGATSSPQINKVFPLYVSIQKNHQKMFQYFWNDLGFLWDEDAFDNIFKLIAKKDFSEYLPIIFETQTLQTIFAAMSYQYKFTFMQHILQLKREFLEEINTQLMQEQANENDEAEEILLNRKMQIDHFFMKVNEQLTKQPYSLHFYLSFSKELIKSAEEIYQQMDECLEIMRKTQKLIKDSDIQVFLHYTPDVAVQIVNDLIDEPTSNIQGQMNSISNAIDKETKNIAMRIKKCPNYKHYKQAVAAQASQVALPRIQ